MGGFSEHPNGRAVLWLLKPLEKISNRVSDPHFNSSPYFTSYTGKQFCTQQAEGSFKIGNQIRSLPCLKLFSDISLDTWDMSQNKIRKLDCGCHVYDDAALPVFPSSSPSLLSQEAPSTLDFFLLLEHIKFISFTGFIVLAIALNALLQTLYRSHL